MDRIKRFICILVPGTECNFKCRYCYLQHCDKPAVPPRPFKHPPETLRKAFSKERMGGTCMVNFTAHGETMLLPDLPAHVRAMLEEGHYVEVVTNATVSKAFGEFAKFPKELLSHLMFKCSYHWQQLKGKGLLDRFFANVKTVRDAGASFTVELMPHDEIVPEIDEIIATTTCELGAPPHVTVGRDAEYRENLPLLTKMSREEYAKTWGRFGSKLFEYKLSVFGKKQTGFCYAGDWMMVLDSGTGTVSQCYRGYRTSFPFEKPSEPIGFKAIGNHCREPHCYNAHAWLTFGCIPGEEAPYYDEVRNRKCVDGTEWLTPECKEFFHQKFGENNPEYGIVRKFAVNGEMAIRGFFKSNHSAKNTAKAVLSPFRRGR